MNKFLLILIIFVISLVPVRADFSLLTPISFQHGLASGYSIIYTNYTSSIVEANVDGSGLTSANVRLIGGITGLVYSSHDPTEPILNSYRIVAIDLSGNIFYFDDNLVNYSLGFFSNPSGAGCQLGGNCNPIRKIYGYSSTKANGLAISPVTGDIISNDGADIIAFDKSAGYAKSVYYTLINGVDYTGVVQSMKFVIDDNYLSVIVSNSNFYAQHIVFQLSNSSKIKSERIFTLGSNTAGLGLIVSSSNPVFNYSFIATNDAGSSFYVQNSTAPNGTQNSQVTEVLTSPATDIGYSDGIVYIASNTGNIVFTRVPAFPIFTVTGEGEAEPAQLTYITATINSLQDTYANNSNILINNKVVVDNSALSVAEILLLQVNQNYRWKTELYDPNNLLIATHFSSPCTLSSFPYTTCSLNETLQITPPTGNWQGGNYTAYLKEYNINTYNLATLDTDTFEVLNLSGNFTGIVVTEPPTSGTGLTAVSAIDGWTALFGLGVNSVSKFLFSLVIISFFMTVGAILLYRQNALAGAVIFGTVPYGFFTFIGYLPTWIVVILGIIIAIKLSIFR